MPTKTFVRAVLLVALLPTVALAQTDRFGTDRRLDNRRDEFGVSSRQAAHMCAGAAETALHGAGYTGVQVVGLKDIEHKPEGYVLSAWVSVSGGGASAEGKAKRGDFRCEIGRGSIVNLGFNGIPGV
ncbi:hypothetical protein EDF56_103255 [Novosphingobium sp. PhB165]|uniref:hypothetical protein n=1 Tax=Novosphingobium sp. PhB165 TaxID=2485105 RepID=UPI00104B600D|nr:hypothetical protein [Novosphingobium sp. PhB165]TCM19612.1 hypothetical protein EDF56_103255 [Novosphingobium sp. PhB165]